MKTNLVGIMVVLTLVLGTTASLAQTAAEDKALTTQATQMDRYATKGQTLVSNRTAADFSGFYGQENSQALAEGLRSGSEVTLTTTAQDGTTSTATFTPPTGSMGNGNVYISMALAQEQLTAAGITDPTAEQIEAAMVGGTFVPGGEPVQGVLEMRASGMGWGQIAQAYGTKLGPVISGMKTANTALSRTSTLKTGTATTTTGSTPTTAAGKAKASTGAGKSGIVTGAGGGANVVGGAKASGGKSGIVTGAGGAAGAGGVSSAGGGAKSQGQGTGIVTGGGAASGAAGGSGGQGKGYGKGGK